MKAIEQNKSLKEVFLQENKKLKLLKSSEVDEALDPKNYLGFSKQIVERAVKKLER
jgi:adenylosuccinate lyase